MKWSSYRVYIFSLLILCLPLAGCHRKLKGASASPKDVEKMQEERLKETEKAYEMAVKRHMKIQTKDTRKRMKQSKKRSDRLIAGKPEYPFFKRIFMPKAKRGKKRPTNQ